MEHDLTKIIQELSLHETLLKTEFDELTSKTRVIADRLSQIQTAKAALGGTASLKSRSKHAESKGKAYLRVPTQSELEEIISKILREKKSIQVADLMQQLKSQLLANGQSRLRLKSTFSKALSSPKFKSDQSQNVSLA